MLSGGPIVGIHIHEVSTIVILVVGIAALVLAIVGVRAAVASRMKALGFVAAAFFALAAKSLFSAWAVYFRALRHEHLELVLSLSDLVVVALLVTPLLRARRRG